MTTRPAKDTGADIAWQGLHHVALVTADLDARVRFYGDGLGMEIGKVMSLDAHGGEAERTTGFEPATSSLGSWRSTN